MSWLYKDDNKSAVCCNLLENIIRMKANARVREEILQVVENQINENKPAETRLTLNRLVKTGYTKEEAKIMIAQCVSVEIFNVMKFMQPFDEKRFIKNLNNLPAEPFEDE
jgi:uncharacterized membrane-anchored protein YjiN (DUF445 family)